MVINLRYCLMSFSLSQKLEKGVSNGHRLAVCVWLGVQMRFLVSVQVWREGSVLVVYLWCNVCRDSGMDTGETWQELFLEAASDFW